MLRLDFAAGNAIDLITMDLLSSEHLAEEQRLALAYTAVDLRARLSAYFALDRRLAQIVSKTTEPMLGQMRLAWWRDMLSKDVSERPAGDEVLDALGRAWDGREAPLIQLIDAWEILVADEEMDERSVREFGEGRGAPFSALGDVMTSKLGGHARNAAARWALADAASNISTQEEREIFVKAGLDIDQPETRLPRSLRGLAVLEALSLRALRAGGRPLMEGRGAGLTAFKVGLLGR